MYQVYLGIQSHMSSILEEIPGWAPRLEEKMLASCAQCEDTGGTGNQMVQHFIQLPRLALLKANPGKLTCTHSGIM